MTPYATVTYRPNPSLPADTDVSVAGEFSNWEPVALRHDAPRQLWTGNIPLACADKNYMYKFIVNGDWILASDGRAVVSDESGLQNHVLRAIEDIQELEDTPSPQSPYLSSTGDLTPATTSDEKEATDDSVLVKEQENEPVETAADELVEGIQHDMPELKSAEAGNLELEIEKSNEAEPNEKDVSSIQTLEMKPEASNRTSATEKPHEAKASQVSPEESENQKSSKSEIESKPIKNSEKVDSLTVSENKPAESESAHHVPEVVKKPTKQDQSTTATESEFTSEPVNASKPASVSISEVHDLHVQDSAKPVPLSFASSPQVPVTPVEEVREIYQMLSSDESSPSSSENEALSIHGEPSALVPRVPGAPDFMAYFLKFYHVVILGFFGYTMQAFRKIGDVFH
ncbi:hypothetical protein NADFUDRAFT_83803 [Nadsonia fulvescens var. elongata DSM 6958]|uniref:AMP-activated protein kinase glycogen-binding domain-containing protein n=1 Tax=Nadsonia fulvescens var. elongata DSM 6958 TaxID=857566 RepID=A0A1E3PG19_9ASCO|nr:hypothetical protein NADFUDRAFT_83803 [Nadsonia fulvescens var. elongata DSM 6958]